MRRLGWLAAAGLVIAACTARSGAGAASPHKTLRWIINGPALATFVSDPVSQRFFAGTKPFVLLRKTSEIAIPAAWNAQTVRSYTSYKAIEKAFERNAVGTDVRAILYDNEAWQFTPLDEQTHVAEYTRKAAELVRSHGLALISAPAVNLVRAIDPSSADKRYDAFVKLNIPRDSARYSDVFVVQAQGSEADVGKYRAFVDAAAAQAKAANSGAIVLAGISTNPSGQRVSAETILAAIHATQNNVDGYWFNVPSPGPYCPRCTEFRPDMAIEVLKGLVP